MESRRGLAFIESFGVLCVRQSSDQPTDREVEGYVATLKKYLEQTAVPRVLVMTEGGAPSPRHRKLVDQTVAPYRPKVRFAIVTDSTFARGVLKAISLVNPFYRGFASSEFEQALRFLDIPYTRTEEIRRVLNMLRAQCG